MYGNNMLNGYPFMPGAPAQMPSPAAFAPQGNINPYNASQNAPAPSPAFLQVGTVKDFDNVTIQPGRQALIMAQNEPYLAFKSADAMGMVTTSFYRLEPVTADQIAQPATEYATKSELAQLQGIVQQLVEKKKKKTAKKEVSE